ncbi:MAG: helix-hairpin-helix domain-containing protein, partial [Synechococcaceae cyanobacterium]|nr:helix-hairpin-helix domain-containing protein [Synechococcaceae cyanobacterium]
GSVMHTATPTAARIARADAASWGQALATTARQAAAVLVAVRLRDEAHRFAVSYHRQQRGERMKRSRLSDIPGLGPKRVKDLLAHFRSIDAIQLASREQIAAAPGMGPALARQVWEYFHPEAEPAGALAAPSSGRSG